MKRYGEGTSSIESRVGERFAVELDSMPGAGYVWSLSSENHGVEVVSHEHHPAGSGIGGQGKETFILAARQPMKTPLVFRYGRPWETEAAKEMTVHLKVPG